MLDQKRISQETLINATWLWMLSVAERKDVDGVALLEAHLRPAFDHLSILVAEEMRMRGEATP
jgi:hypothetical protein